MEAFIGRVEYSFAVFHGCSMLCFLPTGNPGVERLLGKLALSRITETKTDIQTQNARLKVELLAVTMFLKKRTYTHVS